MSRRSLAAHLCKRLGRPAAAELSDQWHEVAVCAVAGKQCPGILLASMTLLHSPCIQTSLCNNNLCINCIDYSIWELLYGSTHQELCEIVQVDAPQTLEKCWALWEDQELIPNWMPWISSVKVRLVILGN